MARHRCFSKVQFGRRSIGSWESRVLGSMSDRGIINEGFGHNLGFLQGYLCYDMDTNLSARVYSRAHKLDDI